MGIQKIESQKGHPYAVKSRGVFIALLRIEEKNILQLNNIESERKTNVEHVVL